MRTKNSSDDREKYSHAKNSEYGSSYKLVGWMWLALELARLIILIPF